MEENRKQATNPPPQPGILCIDPGFAKSGWSYFVGGKVVAAGVLTSQIAKATSDDRNATVAMKDADRIGSLAMQFLKLIEKTRPIMAVIESDGHGALSSRAVRCVTSAWTLAIAACHMMNLRMYLVRAQDARRFVAAPQRGEKTAEKKRRVCGAIRKLHPELATQLDSMTIDSGRYDLSDSVALYHYAAAKLGIGAAA